MVEIAFFLQLMTSCGALSSACEVVSLPSGNRGSTTYKMESKLEWTNRRRQNNIAQIASGITEKRTDHYGGILFWDSKDRSIQSLRTTRAEDRDAYLNSMQSESIGMA